MIRRVYIEITNLCNLSCAFCYRSRREKRTMPAEEFEHVLKQVLPVTEFIYLHVQGEPMVHPQFRTILDLCDRYQAKVQLVTNGTQMSSFTDEELLSHPSLRKISFSLQSIEYHNSPVLPFMERILSFCEAASAASHPYCELRFWRDDQMKQERTGQCLTMISSRYTPSGSGRIRNMKILPGVYVDWSNTFDWPDAEDDIYSERGRCLGAVSQIAVLSDGTVVPCCLDADGQIPLGNVFTEDLRTILDGERYQAMIRGFAENRLTEDLCRRCKFRSRFD